MYKGFTFLKISIFLLLLVVSTANVNSQNNLKVELLNKSNKPLGRPVHYHLFKVTNNSKTLQEFTLSINNTSCVKVNLNNQSDLTTQIFDKNLAKELSNITLNAMESVEFYVKTSHSKEIRLDAWSCFEVKAISTSNKSQNDSVIMKILVPDPENVN